MSLGSFGLSVLFIFVFLLAAIGAAPACRRNAVSSRANTGVVCGDPIEEAEGLLAPGANILLGEVTGPARCCRS